MRVIMVNNFFSGYLGGVERYIASLSKELVSLGVEALRYSVPERDEGRRPEGSCLSSLARLRAVPSTRHHVFMPSCPRTVPRKGLLRDLAGMAPCLPTLPFILAAGR